MGGAGLAAPENGTASFSFLQQASQHLSRVPSGEAFWVGAAYVPPAGADTGWRWLTHPSQSDFGELQVSPESGMRPVAAADAAWGPGFPKLFGARFVGIEAHSPLESCAALRWPSGAAAAMWENFACSSRVARFFVRRFHK